MVMNERLLAQSRPGRLAMIFFVVMGACLRTSGAEVQLELQTNQERVRRYERIDFQISLTNQYRNPFNPDEVKLDIQLTTPRGNQVSVPAFYFQDYERKRIGSRDWFYPKGMPTWQARFAPAEMGTYQAAAILKDRQGQAVSKTVRFECVSSERPGFLRVSRRDPRFLEFTEGAPFFSIGQNLAFIGNQQFVTLSKAESIFSQLAANGANYLRLWTGSEDWALAVEARKSAWGRSWNWNPPIVPSPDATSTGQCLKISGDQAVLKVDPSHTVALRPDTTYRVTCRYRSETALHLEVQGSQGRLDPASHGTVFQHQFKTRSSDHWLANMMFRLAGPGTAWISDLSLREAEGGPELLWEAELNRPVRGFYNPLDCYLLDGLLAAAEKEGLYLQLCLLTRDLYMDALKDPASPEYDRAIADARKFFRHAVGRWGYSTSVAAWEYWNEMNPGLPTDRFYSELGRYLEQVDPYQHLRTTSTWGPSEKDCRHPKLDLADIHFYLRPTDRNRLQDEVEAIQDRTRWLRERAPAKPAHLGEFGLANDKWQPTEEMKTSPELIDVHNALWASALSGASGTALYWWWDRLDPRNVYPLYRPLSRFIADVPWNGGEVQQARATVPDARLNLAGLETRDHAWIWLFNRGASWDNLVIRKRPLEKITNAELVLDRWPAGAYQIQWWNPRDGALIAEEKHQWDTSPIKLGVPTFSHDIACKISRVEKP